jgi:hypothetical protein
MTATRLATINAHRRQAGRMTATRLATINAHRRQAGRMTATRLATIIHTDVKRAA